MRGPRRRPARTRGGRPRTRTPAPGLPQAAKPILGAHLAATGWLDDEQLERALSTAEHWERPAERQLPGGRPRLERPRARNPERRPIVEHQLRADVRR